MLRQVHRIPYLQDNPPRSSSRYTSLLIGLRTMRICLSSLVFLSLLACSGGGPPGEHGGGGRGGGEDAEEADRRILVEVEAVAIGSVADYLETTGTIESEAQADIAAETSGTVTQIAAEEGDSVRRGQLLAVIENPSLDASASRAAIELERAGADLERARTLHTQKAISDSELRQAEISHRTAAASAKEARRTRGFTRLTSPIDGTVAVRDIRLGELASGRAFQVVDLQRLRVVIQLPEKDLVRVRAGQPARLSSAYDEDAVATGSVTRISPVVDPSSGTVRVTVSVDPGQETLRPGQFTKVRLEVDRHNDVLTIPRRALTWEDGDPVAWVVADAPPPEEEEDKEGEEEAEEEGGGWMARLFGGGEEAEEDAVEEDDAEPEVEIPQRIAERRVLEIGFTDPDRVEISDGLEEAEPVVVLGNANLRDGASVRLPEDPAPRSAKDKEEDDKTDEEEG
ncbi:MAG: membrane fusion protein (multidrug efflux system) [Myxococcota bacterium]|jgi:membrane fusion protein (multidrug efflux system)